MISLADPLFLLIGFIFIPLFIRKKAAFLGYSGLHLMDGHLGSWFARHLPQVFFALTIAFLVFGLARPQKNNVVSYERFLARDIILVVDLSYSMEDSFKNKEGDRKIDVAKNALQLAGGYGFMEESHFPRLHSAAILLSIGGGTVEIQKKELEKMYMLPML